MLSVCVALVFGFTENPEKLHKIYWFVFMCIVLTVRFFDTRYWRLKLDGTEYDTYRPMIRFVVVRYMTAVGLSSYAVIFYQSMSVIELASTIIVISAMAGGGATILAAHKHLVISFPLILLLPISILCFFSSQEFQKILGGLGGIFSFVMYVSAKRSFEFTNSSLKIKNKHADLLDAMQLKNEEISQVNANLEAKVKDRTEKLFELYNIDSLTKLYNRVAFSENLKLLITLCKTKQQKLAMLFIDLDGFKSINDSHGHGIGDKVLVETSKRLSVLAKEKQHVCRWGGDEFLIVMQNTDVDLALEFSKNLIKELSKPMSIEHFNLSIGATVGISVYPDHAKDEIQLIGLADTAMYVQKQTNKSDVLVFTEKMREVRDRELMLKEGLLQALNRDELFVVYQPIIDSKTRKLSTCEALLRWHFNGQIISPVEFIPIAEQYGIIHSLGAWILTKSCEHAANWVFGESVGVSVNVSVAQVVRGDLAVVVTQALKQSGLDPRRLYLEITESIFAEDLEYVLDQIQTIQQMGVKISVDDFGTGFSSLALFQSLSADVVKIDQSFTNSINQGGKAIIQATQYIAKELGYTLVVEGVETKEQVEILTEMGIENLQGYYFSKPATLDELLDWYQTHQQNL